MDIMSKFNLPKYVKGKSFSEASAIIAKKFEDRSDPESIATLNDLQGRLQQAQEFVKAEQEKASQPEGAPAEGTAQHQMPDGSMMPGAVHGGQGGAEELAAMAAMQGGPGQMPQQPMGQEAMPQGMQQDPNMMTYGGMKYMYGGKKYMSGGKMYGSGGSMLANMYDDGGPVHNATPHPHDDTASILSEGQKTLNEMRAGIANANTVNDLAIANRDPQQGGLNAMNFAPEFGGFGAQGAGRKGFGERFGGVGNVDPSAGTGYEAPKNMGINGEIKDSFGGDGMKSYTDLYDPTNGYSDSSGDDKKKKKTKFNPAEALRYAPTLMSAFKLADLKKPTQVGMDRLGNRYNEQLVDERGLQNSVQQGALNVRDAILGSSGGSAAAARANLLGSQLQSQKGLSAANMQATEMNRAENRAGQAFNRDTDKVNLQQSNMQNEFQLEQDAAYQQNRSKLLAQIGADLGGIGQEELFKRYPELMGLSYNSRGKFIKA